MSGHFTRQVNKWLRQEKCTGAAVFIPRFVHMANVTRPTNHSLNLLLLLLLLLLHLTVSINAM